MILYDLLNKISVKAEIQVCDERGKLLQQGIRGETMWEDELIGRKVCGISPGIVTKIFLIGW